MALPFMDEIVTLTMKNRTLRHWEDHHVRVVYSDAARARIIASVATANSKEPAIATLINAFTETEKPLFNAISVGEPVDEIHLG